MNLGFQAWNLIVTKAVAFNFKEEGMRAFVAWMLALGLVATPAMAKTSTAGDKDGAAAKTSDKATADKTADKTPDKTADAADSAAATSTSNAATSPKAVPATTSLESEMQQLRDLLEAQTKQIQMQNEQMREQQARVEAMEVELKAATTPADTSYVAAPDSRVPNPNGKAAASGNSGNLAIGTSNGQDASPDNPIALHYKGITLTPGGFFAAETVWRGKATSSDINTPFNSVPLPGSSASSISEFNASARQSRISMLAEGKLANVKIGGYYETDFLSAGTTSNDNESNSYTMRQRQFWAQAKFDDGLTITGGQMWSLVTETLHAMDNRTEALPMTIDPQYTVGFSWARQYGFRVTKSLFDDKLTLGFSAEAPQTTFTVHGNPTGSVTTGTTTVLVPNSTACPAPAVCTATVGGATTTYTNFLIGQPGTGGGLYNPLANYSYNPAPDLIFKAVLEPGFGHYEIFGIVSQFRDRVFPCATASATAPCTLDPAIMAPSAVLASNDSRTGGGVGANARWSLLAKKVDLGVHFLGGSGVGRYGTAGLADATIRPDGTIALLRSYQALGTLQFHPTPKLDVYLNVGGEYVSRGQYTKAGATLPNEGYGALGFNNAGCWTETLPTTTVPAGTNAGSGYIPGGLSNCTGDTRNILEGTIGFWYRFYKGPKGAVAYGMQYSYVQRNTWSGLGDTTSTSGYGVSGQPAVSEPMWLTSFRYYLP
ncbi:MAG: hypothetical protein WA192_17710 [Candidatus Acidiferrales bacterium]